MGKPDAIVDRVCGVLSPGFRRLVIRACVQYHEAMMTEHQREGRFECFLEDVLRACEDVFPADAVKKSRLRLNGIRCRQMFCFVAARHTFYRYNDMAAFISRDRSTVIHSIQVMQELIAVDEDMKGKYERILEILKINYAKND